MKLRVLACAGAFFCASVSTVSAFEFSKLVSPFVSAFRFVGGLLPPGGDGEEGKTRDKGGREKQGREIPPPSSPDPDKVIGTIRFAYDDFVLIYTPVRLELPAGTRVTTVGKDGVPRDVELSLSEERKGTFLVADVAAGEPMPGDLVVLAPGTGSPKVAQYQVLE